MTKTVAFDLDETLIATDCAEDWLAFAVERGLPRAQEAREECLIHMASYASGDLDMNAYIKSWCKPIFKLNVARVEKLMEDYVETKIRPHIMTQGKRQVENHLANGDRVLLISASPDLLVQAIAREFKIEYSMGIRLVIENQCYTDRALTPLTFQQGKVDGVKSWLAQLTDQNDLTLDLAYSDSINDLPLLNMAAQAICINPNQALTDIARSKSWQVMHWQ